MRKQASNLPVQHPGVQFARHKSPLYALFAGLLPGDPFANVWIAIHQRDVRCFAPGQKIDAVLTGQSHIFQVENDAAALFFRADECFQLGDMLCVDPAAYRKNHFPVRRPVNSEHSALQEDLGLQGCRSRSNRK